MEHWNDLAVAIRQKVDSEGPSFEIDFDILAGIYDEISQRKLFTKTPGKRNAIPKLLFPMEKSDDDDDDSADEKNRPFPDGTIVAFAPKTEFFQDASSPDMKGEQDPGLAKNASDDDFEYVKDTVYGLNLPERIEALEIFSKYFSECYNEQVRSTNTTTKFLAAAIEGISSSVGKRVGLPEQFQSATLWNSVGKIASNCTKQEDDRITDLEKEFSVWQKALEKTKKVVAASVKESVFNDFAQALADWKNGVENALDDAARANNGNAAAGNRTHTVQNGGNGISFTEAQRLENLIIAQSQQIDSLNRALDTLKAAKDNKVARFGGFTLKSLVCATDWCTQHPDFVNHFGRLPNLHLLCALVFEQLHGETEWWGTFKDVHKSGLLTTQNIKALKSFQLNIPLLFSASQTFRPDQSTSAFDRYKDSNSFDAAVVDRLISNCEVVVRDWQDGIDSTFAAGSVEHNLCSHALTACSDCFGKKVQFLATRRDKFANKGYPKDKAWALATRLGYTVLVEIGKPRGKIHDQVKHHNLQHAAALHLLGTFRSLARMKELVSHSFERDQALSTCIVEYSMESQAAGSDLSSFDVKIDALKRDFANKYVTQTSMSSYAKKTETVAKNGGDYVKKNDISKFVTHNSLTEKLKGYATK